MSIVDDYKIGTASYSWSESCTGSGGYGRWRVFAEHKKTGNVVISQGSTKAEAEKNIIINIKKDLR